MGIGKTGEIKKLWEKERGYDSICLRPLMAESQRFQHSWFNHLKCLYTPVWENLKIQIMSHIHDKNICVHWRDGSVGEILTMVILRVGKTVTMLAWRCKFRSPGPTRSQDVISALLWQDGRQRYYNPCLLCTSGHLFFLSIIFSYVNLTTYLIHHLIFTKGKLSRQK